MTRKTHIPALERGPRQALFWLVGAVLGTVLLAMPLCAATWQPGDWQHGDGRSRESAPVDRRPEGDRRYGGQPAAPRQYEQPTPRGGDYGRPSDIRNFDRRSFESRGYDRNQGSAPGYRDPRQYSTRPDYRERGSAYSGFDRQPSREYQDRHYADRAPQAYGQPMGRDGRSYPSGPSGRPQAGRPDFGGRTYPARPDAALPGVPQPQQYPGRPPGGSPYAAPGAAATRGEAPRHGDWLRDQMRYPADEQERRLEQDPYYRSLPPDQQIELRGRLKRFNAMPPERRQLILDRMERFDRMPPEAQRQTHELWQQFRGMEPERKDMMRRTLRQMRDMPPDARDRFLNSPTTQTHFSPEEMQMLRGFNSLGFVEHDR